LTLNLHSKVASIIRKDDGCSGFLVNYYVCPRRNGIGVPDPPVPRKRTYIGFPAAEVMQTVYVSFLPEEKFLGLAYFIYENAILSGLKAFCLGMADCYFLRFRLSVDLSLEPFGELPKPNIGSLTEQTWSIRQKLNRVIMEAMNTSSLNAAYKRHKTIDFSRWEWSYFTRWFPTNLAVKKKGTVTLRINRLDCAKESCKVKTNKYSLQFTTRDEITLLKTILGSTITISARNGFPTAPKRLRADDEYRFSKQTAGASEYVNAILPGILNGFFFLFTEDTGKLRVTSRWERLGIADQRVGGELRGLRLELDSSSASSDNSIIELHVGEDFTHDQAQFEITQFNGGLVHCIVIESNSTNWTVGQQRNWGRDFVHERLQDNY
jgi:hypothetical protein